MKSKDVTALYEQLPLGALVQIVPDRLPKVGKASKATLVAQPQEAAEDWVTSARSSTKSAASRTVIANNVPRT
jgi:hypothetical protein